MSAKSTHTKPGVASPPAKATATAHAIYKSLGVSPRRILTLALAGRVRSLIEPGRTPRYYVADVEAVVASEPDARSVAS
jgi:hypothetical protein